MRWKITLILLSGLAALLFGLGVREKPQRPVLHEVMEPMKNL